MSGKTKNITVKIKRRENSDPETTWWDSYELEARASDRVLDLLEKIRGSHDDTLAFRSNCGHGTCGSDAMNINGNNRLACRTLLSDLGFPPKVIIKPLPGFEVKKDLVVNEKKLEDSSPGQLVPFLQKNENTTQEKYRTEEAKTGVNEGINCIECGCCQSACPVTWHEDRFPGPQIFTRLSRYISDNKGDALLSRVDSYSSLWKCRTMYNCVEVCPQEINITALLSELKAKTTGEG